MLIDLTIKINPKTATSNIAKLGHHGTHLDIMENDDIPIENFITTGKMFDITSIRDRIIELQDLKNTIINEKDFVIFRSHWLKDHDYATPAYFANHPHLSDELIDFLLDKKIAFIGLDFPGAQRKEKHIEVDNKCAAKNVFIIENLNNLHLLTQDTFKAYCFPMNLSGSSGIPIRVIAEIN